MNKKDDLALQYVIDWMSAELYADITIHAESGDEDSLQVMQVIMEYMTNIYFHINNKSTPCRVSSELDILMSYINEFN